MSTQTNKAIVRRFIEQVLNKQRHDLAEEFLAESVEFHGPGDTLAGLTAVAEWFATLATAFPDWQATINEVIAEGDNVVLRMTSNGTHQGEWAGLPATGKPFTQDLIVIYRLNNGKIVEGRVAADNLSLMQQLGVIPAPQAS